MKKLSDSLDKQGPMPLYFQVKEDLIKRITENELSEGTNLPPENRLMEMYEVSRTTIRQAVDILVREGYLEKRRGVGTFVAKPDPNYWELEELRSFDDEAKRKGLSSRTQILNFEIVVPEDEILEIFKNKHQSFYKLDRLRYIDEKPLELATTYVPVDLAPNLTNFDFTSISLFKILNQEYNLTINHAEKTFQAVNIDDKGAKLLNLEPNTAVQLVKTVTYNSLGEPIEHSVTYDSGLVSRFKLTLNIH